MKLKLAIKNLFKFKCRCSWKYVLCLPSRSGNYVGLRGYECIKCGSRKVKLEWGEGDPLFENAAIEWVNKSPGKNVVKLRLVK